MKKIILQLGFFLVALFIAPLILPKALAVCNFYASMTTSTKDVTSSSVCTVSGVDGIDQAASETSTTNNAIFTLSTNGSITINPGAALVLGRLNLNGGNLAIADGGQIKPGSGVWVADADADGWPDSTTLFVSTASGRRRLSLMRGYSSAAVDCSASVANAVNNCFLVATGGTITTSGNYKYHTFSSSGTFTVTTAGFGDTNNTVQYTVVAGGGGGGGSRNGFGGGGGGGAGGMLESSLVATVTSYSVTIGGGGAGGIGDPCATGSNGGNSTFHTTTTTGGGGGGGCASGSAAGNGGSGGGAGGAVGGTFGTGIAGQGSNGGPGQTTGSAWGGGGGGAGGAGVLAGAGAGIASTVNGTIYAVGGAPGYKDGYAHGVAGTANTGKGGGGGSSYIDSSDPENVIRFNAVGGSGGSGIVILRYLYQ